MLDKHESKNAELFIQAAKLFSRVCGRHLPILDECLPLVERAVAQEDTNPTFISELAYQQLMQGRLKDSLKTSKAAGKLGETSIDVMLQVSYTMNYWPLFRSVLVQMRPRVIVGLKSNSEWEWLARHISRNCH